MSKYNDTKFYWLQLKEDFFDEDAISWLEEQPNGKDYCLFYLKLCLKSLKTNGIMIRQVGEMLVPYDCRKLAEITKTDIDTVVVAMQLLKQIGLIKVLDNGELYLTKIENMVGSQSVGALKKQQQRLVGGQMSAKCPPEIDIEIDIDINKEKVYKEKETAPEANGQSPSAKKQVFNVPSYEEVEQYAKIRGRVDLARKFYDYYDTGDWKDKDGKKIKCWKQKFITWENKNTQTQQTSPKDSNYSSKRQYTSAELDAVFDNSRDICKELDI